MGGEKIKQNKKILTHILIIAAIVLLVVVSLQAGFAATTYNINNTTSGGIRDALNTATAGDRIELEEGTYTGNNNTKIEINKNITIQGKTKNKVILDAQGLSRIFAITTNGLNVTFINITFCNAVAPGSMGGAVYDRDGSAMKFIGCTFNNNSAAVGAAISSTTDLNIVDSIFTNNFATNNAGAISLSYNNPIFSNISNIQDCVFINNSATNNGGALVFIAGSIDANAIVNLLNCTITNNFATNGGGIRLYSGSDCNITVNIFDSNISDNSATNGGGIFITILTNGCSNVNIFDSIIADNSATNDGGGICSFPGENSTGNITISVNGSNITGNDAGNNGGGVSSSTGVGSSGNSTVNIADSTIADNTAGNDGGGISSSTGENSTGNSNVNVSESDITGNGAGNNGGGVSSSTGVGSSGDSSVNIADSTIADNAATNDGGGISSSTGENSAGNSNVNVSESDIIGNGAGNDGGGVSSSTGVGSEGDSTVNIDDSTINDNTAGNEGGAISSNTGENSTGNSTVNVNDSDLENNSGGNGGDTIFSSTGDGSSGDSSVNVGGDSKITNNNPNRDDGGLSSSTGDNSTGESNINIDPSVTITRLSASSTIVAPNATVGKPTTIRGVAKDQNNKPLANIKLTVTIDGKVYTVTTNNVGEWSLTYIPTKMANIQVTVALNQNNVYYAFSKTASFRAIQTVTLTISAPTINQGKKTIIKVTLKDANGNILKNKKVTITINKKTYTATTNNNGIATFKIAGLKGGKYTLIANFAGNNDYKSLTVSGTQKVNSKVNLGIISIKKIKSSNKKNPKYKITIINKGSLKSKATVLSLFHIRNGIKIKTKYFKVKAIAAGKKISIIVDYFPDKAKHRYCTAHYTLDPKNKNKEILLANNKKSISLKH